MTINDRAQGDPLQAALVELVTALEKRKVRYALIGGLATGYRSRPRYTADVDVMIDVPQITLPALLEELLERGFEFDLREVIDELTRHHLAVLWRDGVRVDWLKPILPVYLHVLATASEEPGPPISIHVASVEGLLVLKMLAFRLQDQSDIEALIAANPGRIDVEWVRTEWATLFSLEDPRMVWFMGMLNG